MNGVNLRTSLCLLIAAHLSGGFILSSTQGLVDDHQFGFLAFVLHLSTLVVLAGQASLLGLWAALGDESLIVRFPRSLFLLGLTWIVNQISVWLANLSVVRAIESGLESAISQAAGLLMVFLITYVAIVLLSWLSKRRLRAAVSAEHGANLHPAQFTLMGLLVWTAGIALLLGLGRWVVPLDRALPWVRWSAFVLPVLVLVVVQVLAGVPTILLLLANWSTRRAIWVAATWLFVLTVCETLILLPLPRFSARLSRGPLFSLPTEAAVHNLTTFAVIALSLLLVRAWGYRWKRAEPAAQPIAGSAG